MPDFFTAEETIYALLMSVLVSAGIVTLWCIHRAKLNLEAEERAFKECRKKLRVYHEPELIYSLKSSAEVQRVLCSGNSEAEQELNSGYVSDRLYAVIRSVKPDNLVRKIPPLSDLHELTMQRERSGIATSVFRALAPGILVLGILGTLLGVHNKLDDVSRDVSITALTDALIPGAMAVFFTVVVMLFRGVYNRKLSEFISAFDEYTLKTIFLIFQPPSQSNVNIKSIIDALQKIKEVTQNIEKVYEEVNEFQDAVYDCEQQCISLLLQMQHNLQLTGDVFASSYQNQQALRQLREQMLSVLMKQVDRRQQDYESLLEVKQVLESAEQNFRRVYEDLGYKGISRMHAMPELHDALKEMHKAHVTLSEYVGKFFSMPGLGDSLNVLQRLDMQIKEMPAHVDQYVQNEAFINEADKSVDDKIEQMQYLTKTAETLNASLMSKLESLKQYRAEFFEAYRKVHDEMIMEKLRGHVAKMSFMQRRHTRPHGFRVWLKNRMIKLRTLYEKPAGIVTLALLLILLVINFVVLL